MNTTPQRRLWLIELIAYWEGQINASHLVHFFGISRQQASKDIGEYRRLYPGHLHYCDSAKAHLVTGGFRCRQISGDVAEYLNWMTGQSGHPLPEKPRYQLPHQALQHPPRNVSPTLVRPLLRAIREQRRLEVDYVSVTNPSREGRIIVPHTFVNTGLRWHLRAWCEKHQDYRDFVLSRFRGTPELLEASPHGAGDDRAWQTQVELLLKPDPRLSPAQQEALAHDYGMADGELRLATRAALAQYLLLEMQVNVKMLDGNPAAQQLILANADQIKPWLFGA
ncbi:WYL domain-containing protein [Gallaecimonas sp. GXIMD4217]|uniref:helix-turn-helix transcriptional regulator n=1 Tax=Gallaecimonas sp. GXIMD4217 TaxID=3131927 RepID=UPI00311B15C6